MQIEAVRKVAADWCDAWNRRDLDAIMEHYADDVEFSSPTVNQEVGSCRWLAAREEQGSGENFRDWCESPGSSLRTRRCAAWRQFDVCSLQT